MSASAMSQPPQTLHYYVTECKHFYMLQTVSTYRVRFSFTLLSLSPPLTNSLVTTVRERETLSLSHLAKSMTSKRELGKLYTGINPPIACQPNVHSLINSKPTYTHARSSCEIDISNDSLHNTVKYCISKITPTT